MNWLTISILAYFLLAMSFILDKMLIKNRIPKPAVFAFFVALLSLVSVVLIPFGVRLVSWSFFGLSIVSGASFIWGLLFYYQAIKRNEISRIAPLVGTITQISAFLISVIFLKGDFDIENIIGIGFLVVGGFLVSFDLPLKKVGLFKGIKFSLISGFLLAVAYILFERVYIDFRVNFSEKNVFINGFFWTRIGLVIGGLTLLVKRSYRQNIFKAIFKENKKKNSSIKKSKKLGTIVLFLLNKVFGGTASILINQAIFLGGAVLVQATSSVQFVFVLIFASLAAIKFPNIFEEKLYFWDWVQKIGAIGLIAFGIFLIS